MACDDRSVLRRLLVTGASGLLGYAVVKRLSSEGEVVGTVNRHSVELPYAHAIAVDLTAHGAVDALFEAVRPSWVVHCAALANVDQCEDQPEQARRLNADLPRHIARAARDHGSWMLHMSTDAVFEGEHGPYAEGDPTGPINEYSRSKLLGEQAVLETLPDRAIVVRATIYGWNVQPKVSLSEWYLENLRGGRRVIGFQDAIFTPILVEDLADIFSELIARPVPGLYHVGSPNRCSKYEFAVSLARQFGLDPALITPGRRADVTLRAPRPRDTSLVTTMMARHLGHQAPTVLAGIGRLRALEATSPRYQGA